MISSFKEGQVVENRFRVLVFWVGFGLEKIAILRPGFG